MTAAAGEPGDQGAMIRSEERLDVTTRRVPTGRAVLRKVIVVEQRTITVDVAHEEVRLEQLPLDEEADDGTEATRGSHLALPELVLHEEQIVVTKRTVPVERVRVEIATVEEDRTVAADLRREVVDVEDGTTGPPAGREG